jgi:hypothetical protein
MAEDVPAGERYPGQRPESEARLVKLRRVRSVRPWISRAQDSFSIERFLMILSVAAVIFVLGYCMTVLFDFRTPEEMHQDELRAQKAAERAR